MSIKGEPLARLCFCILKPPLLAVVIVPRGFCPKIRLC
ncbi:rfbP protein [Vibrio cholerae]|nr:rfbP protein [Vibrio cholerae]TXZ52766.1 rfbP protein [Vibrio cholerae]